MSEGVKIILIFILILFVLTVLGGMEEALRKRFDAYPSYDSSSPF